MSCLAIRPTHLILKKYTEKYAGEVRGKETNIYIHQKVHKETDESMRKELIHIGES